MTDNPLRSQRVSPQHIKSILLNLFGLKNDNNNNKNNIPFSFKNNECQNSVPTTNTPQVSKKYSKINQKLINIEPSRKSLNEGVTSRSAIYSSRLPKNKRNYIRADADEKNIISYDHTRDPKTEALSSSPEKMKIIKTSQNDESKFKNPLTKSTKFTESRTLENPSTKIPEPNKDKLLSVQRYSKTTRKSKAIRVDGISLKSAEIVKIGPNNDQNIDKTVYLELLKKEIIENRKRDFIIQKISAPLSNPFSMNDSNKTTSINIYNNSDSLNDNNNNNNINSSSDANEINLLLNNSSAKINKNSVVVNPNEYILQTVKRLKDFKKTHKEELSNKLSSKTRQEQLQNDPQTLQKLSQYKDFLLRINISNGVKIVNSNNNITYHYKYYIGKGNNNALIKAIMKKRWWWSVSEVNEHDEINFLWTQWKQKNFIKQMKCHKEEDINGIDDDKNEEKSKAKYYIPPTPLPPPVHHDLRKNFSSNEIANYRKLKLSYIIKANKFQQHTESSMLGSTDFDMHLNNSLNPKCYTLITNPTQQKICNHLEKNDHLCNKKALFYNIRLYYEALKKDPFQYIPLTFHLKDGVIDNEYLKFMDYFNKKEREIQAYDSNNDEQTRNQKSRPRNIWIIKPGENSNRGCGIRVSDNLKEIKYIVNSKETHSNGKKITYIIQQYIDKPFLYNKRKFDIRCYMLLTSVVGVLKGYWYEEGYMRTSSKEFNLKNLSNRMIHLTNDAIQNKGEEYGKYENGNKLSYSDFQRYLDNQFQEKKHDFMAHIYPKMKAMAKDSINAVYGKIDPYKREQSFEIFGLDFMLDENFDVWLIEINTNPCLETSCPQLARIIPGMVENAFRIALDPLFPPPPPWPSTKKYLLPENILESNKFKLIFDEKIDGLILKQQNSNLFKQNENFISEMDEDIGANQND